MPSPRMSRNAGRTRTQPPIRRFLAKLRPVGATAALEAVSTMLTPCPLSLMGRWMQAISCGLACGVRTLEECGLRSWQSLAVIRAFERLKVLVGGLLAVASDAVGDLVKGGVS